MNEYKEIDILISGLQNISEGFVGCYCDPVLTSVTVTQEDPVPLQLTIKHDRDTNIIITFVNKMFYD